ncbi:hypothetical protein [Paraburkholderia sacchari]|uniref:Uncharacterized protein n=1 Tax=Paraburkholderia sacchari TaxID=159450 RepID=A0A8T6ZFC1_9BURK|nr:hypothetical protein [Paraburkholderia sacchari]NLP63223.1 hypothetical protein [Paraburkholderia sacchari]
MQSQLADYSAAVNSGKLQPFSTGKAPGTYFDAGNNIVFGPDTTQSDTVFVGAMSHELGHFENQNNDQAFASRYQVNVHDPYAYNVAALIGAHGEGEAVYNNWKARQEVLGGTATPDNPGTRIAFEVADQNTQKRFDDQHAADVIAGKSDDQDRNQLITLGMNDYVNGNPSTAPGKTYYAYYGSASGAPAPEPGASPLVSFSGDDKGDITSMTEWWPSGNVDTQRFENGKIQSSQKVSADGTFLSTATYRYGPDGSYSVDVKDGNRGPEYTLGGAQQAGTPSQPPAQNQSANPGGASGDGGKQQDVSSPEAQRQQPQVEPLAAASHENAGNAPEVSADKGQDASPPVDAGLQGGASKEPAEAPENSPEQPPDTASDLHSSQENESASPEPANAGGASEQSAYAPSDPGTQTTPDHSGQQAPRLATSKQLIDRDAAAL